jgi:hypothetical protein
MVSGENSTGSIRVTGHKRSTISHSRCATRSRETRSDEPDAFALRCFLRRWCGGSGTVARGGGSGCLGEVFPFLGLAQPGPTRFGVQRRLLSADRAQRTIVPDFLRRSRPYGSCHDGLTPSTRRLCRRLLILDGQLPWMVRILRRVCAIGQYHLSSRRLFSGGCGGNSRFRRNLTGLCPAQCTSRSTNTAGPRRTCVRSRIRRWLESLVG